jgi:hypothetical protein
MAYEGRDYRPRKATAPDDGVIFTTPEFASHDLISRLIHQKTCLSTRKLLATSKRIFSKIPNAFNEFLQSTRTIDTA